MDENPVDRGVIGDRAGDDIRRRALTARFLARMRNNFIAGLVVIAPVGMTVWLIWTLTGWVDSFVLPLVPNRFAPEQYIGLNIRGLGVIFFLFFTIFVGWMTKGLIGRTFVRWGEWFVGRVPVIRSIYHGLKQIVETIFSQTEAKFDKACLIEYPRKGLWSLAFVSTRARGEIGRQIGGPGEIMSVFVPTTPNPTSGFLLFVPRQDLVELDMSIEEAAKLVISAGLVMPEDRGARPAAVAERLPA